VCLACISTPAASGSKSSSNRASDGSKRVQLRNSDHICRGPVIQLPKADKPGKAPTGGIAHKNLVQEQSAKFREAVMKDSFPPLVLSYLLKDYQDWKNNASLSSFLNIAAKGCKPGAKYTPRSLPSLSYSWNETSTKAEDWLPVSKDEEDIFRWRLQYGTSREVHGEVDEMAPGNGAFGTTQMGVEERVNSWLAGLCKNSILPLDSIEFINAYGKVEKMYQLPKKTKNPQRVSKKSSLSPPSPPKFLWTSSPEFPSRKPKKDVKGKTCKLTSVEKDKVLEQIIKISEEFEEESSLFKQTVKISDEEDKLIKKHISKASDSLHHALKTLKLNKVINDALVYGNTWYPTPRFINNEHKVDMLTARAFPPKSTASKLMALKSVKPIHPQVYKDAVVDTIRQEVQMAQRFALNKGSTFIVNLETFGSVKHSPENPVWEIPGFCYLAAINIAVDLKQRPFWPANPTVYELSQIGYKYRKLQLFTLYEKVEGQHYSLVMKQPTELRDNSGWTNIDFLAKGPRALIAVGGDDKSDVKILDGTNYQQWAPKMRPFLMAEELSAYVNGIIKRPYCQPEPHPPVPLEGATTVTPFELTTHADQMRAYNEAKAIQLAWDTADGKALGMMQLKMADKLQYLVMDTSTETWNNIKTQFDASGPAAIFVDFKSVINYRFDEKKEPSVQVTELNTKLNCLASHGFIVDTRLQAMVILCGLPQSWDGVQGSILANHAMDSIDVPTIMPILQEEWSR
jgi:hypothetical protein